MRKTWVWTPLLLITVATLSYLLFLLLSPPPLPEGLLYGNGHIEGTEVSVSAEVTGRVVESRIVEGQTVAANDVLVRLDDADVRTQLAHAQAQAEAVRQEQSRLAEQLRTWQHHRQTAQNDVERYRALRGSGIVTAQRLDEVENRFQEARGQVRMLEAGGAQTAARLEAAQRQVQLLRLQLEKTVIRAPLTSTVLAKGIEVGELATPGRVVAVLVDLSRLELKVYIAERNIGKVKLGDPARVRVDAFPARSFEATVARVDQRAQFTPRDIHMPEERVRMVFGVTLTVANQEGVLKPGMPADAWIRWQPEVPWPDHLVVPRRSFP